MLMLLIVALVALPLPVQAQSASTPPAVKLMKMGGQSMLTGANGMTLYTTDADTAAAGKSTCNGPCAAIWPPLAAAADAKPVGKFTIITRDDGSLQWAYAGKPLYNWKNDKQPGDMTGEGVAGKWHVAYL
jgi:predicted lipoprotein with Yx(FWY)xxD motif